MKRASFALLLLALACQPVEPAAKEGSCGDKTQVVDPALLAFLSKAKATHLQADVVEKDHPEEAISALEQLVRSPVPGGANPPPEAREVLADALARLAELKAARGELDAAAANVDRGLELASERTYFRGRLYEVRVGIEKRRYEDAKGKGDEAAARAAKDRAAAAFKENAAIQDEVIQRALEP